MFRNFMVALAFALCAAPGLAQAQSITPLQHAAPGGAAITFQLTDGTVFAQSLSNNSVWYKLTPDNTGSYVKGTWTRMASLPTGYSPYAFASAVLADGRVLIEGGEYDPGSVFSLTNLGAIYDPTTDGWTMVAPPAGWDYIGDSPSTVLPDGKYLIGDKINKKMAELDPVTMTWTAVGAAGKSDFNAEEGWTLMPDGSILTLDVKDGPNTEIYSPSLGTWQSAGDTPRKLNGPPCCSCFSYGGKKPYCPPGEIGPALLMPDGSVFATGAVPKGHSTAHTAIYAAGAWKAGPNFPQGDEAGDSFAALLPNGHALVEGISGRLYEFDGQHLTLEPLNAGGNSLMVLPTGEVLIGGVSVYSSSGSSDAAWAPTVTSCPATLHRGSTFQIFGTQFNGLSQANSFGDELETTTNYPLVRITNNSTGHVFYARTHDHSTMGVATGGAIVSTHVDVPSGMETGASTVVVVANGIPSAPTSVTVK